MQEIATPVTLRHLIPSEGMCIHKIDEVPIKDIPIPPEPEEAENS